MKPWKRSGVVAISAAIAFALLQAATVFASPPPSADNHGHAQVAATIRTAQLAEPLVATGPTSPREDLSLSQALRAYEHRTQPDDVSTLTSFLAEHPDSGWAPALLTNLGLSYLHYGYFSQAIDAWQRAWVIGKEASEPRARALVDRAVGELARLYASLGHIESLAALFDDIGSRPVTGSATEAVQVARELLTLVETDPRHLFNCGPRALESLLLADKTALDQAAALRWYRAGPNGTNLVEVARLADNAKFEHQLVFRKPGQPVPMPAIVHWKVGHFAAIIGEANGRFHIADPVFPGSGLWVTQSALDAEASGYFLVPAGTSADTKWRTVDATEASGVWGKGPTNGTEPGDAGDPPADGPDPAPDVPPPPCPDGICDPGLKGSGPDPDPAPDCPMCGYKIKESSVSLTLSDTPVGYTPPIGPSAKVRITYNQREASQPANFSFFNVSPKWTLNWLSYVTDDPTNPGANTSRVLPDGGAYYYKGYNSSTGQFAAQNDDGSILVRVSATPIMYQRRLRNGRTEVYAQSDGSAAFPRRIFLSQSIDPQGNALTLTYDGQQRLVSLTDAVGRQTSFAYGQPGRPLLVTQIADPFGRSATLTYDAGGRLSSITDVIGLTSKFTYDANSLVNTLTTPYGTTTFAYTAPGTSSPPRFVQVTDPLGYHEREEWLEPAPIPSSDNGATVPQSMPVALTNQYLQYRNSFHWDKNAYVVAGCTPTGGCDYTKARIRHFAHVPSTTTKSTAIESVKYPLQNRIWYNYPGQSSSIDAGTNNQPIAIGRVLDDGTTQLSQFSYATTGFFNLTKVTDPVGRSTYFTYAANQVDLLEIAQTTANGVPTSIAQFIYNGQHRPTIYTDATGQTTFYEYNGVGQRTSVTNPLNQTTSYQYDSSRNLTTVTNANGVTAATFTYDTYARVRTFTDAEGWTVTYDYDAADRVIKITYPDSTTDRYTYDKLDLASYQDRLGRVWKYTYDANRRRTTVTNPLGQQKLMSYNDINQLTSLTDFKGYTTAWTYDVEGRLTSKQYVDTSTVTYGYENTTSRLKTVTDALGQVKQYGYTKDDRIVGVSYANAVNPTPNVTFAYDTYFPRPVSMTDGTGTTQFSYINPFSLGALQLQQECFIPTGGSTCSHQISYVYDELGRMVSRTVSGAGAETFQYDAIGRVNSHQSDLGQFALSYLGQTKQLTQRQLLPVSSNVMAAWSYLPNSGDRRLAGINNTGLATSQFSNFQFTTTPESIISALVETSDSATAYPGIGTQTASYNNLNQLVNLSGQNLTYDSNGNLLSDGQRVYSWDAENRLVKITYPGQPGKQTDFTYDGLDRRTAIASTPAGGGSAVTTNYVWCTTRLCQARDTSNAVTRAYYDEGEFVPGSPAQPYYYGTDQLGSVRRVFASTSSAPAFGYDSYGNALQATVPLTDFGYAGMFYNADSGLYLTQYRVYNPNTGRWLSRDPIGESSDPAANLYAYVRGNPLNLIDPLGLVDFPPGGPTGGPPAEIPGGPWTPAGPGQQPGTYFGPPQPKGPRTICRWVPPENPNAPPGSPQGPPGSQGYWKTQAPGERSWSHYDQRGNSITAEEAHPNPLPSNPLGPMIRYTTPWGIFFGIVLYSPGAQ